MQSYRPRHLLPALSIIATMASLCAHADEAANDGEMLYRNHCTQCHESQVHIRDTPKATSYQILLAEIERWTKAARVDWGEREISAVAKYLNRLYYHLDEEPEKRARAASAQLQLSSRTTRAGYGDYR